MGSYLDDDSASSDCSAAAQLVPNRTHHQMALMTLATLGLTRWTGHLIPSTPATLKRHRLCEAFLEEKVARPERYLVG